MTSDERTNRLVHELGLLGIALPLDRDERTNRLIRELAAEKEAQLRRAKTILKSLIICSRHSRIRSVLLAVRRRLDCVSRSGTRRSANRTGDFPCGWLHPWQTRGSAVRDAHQERLIDHSAGSL
jgi:hypothetical protein